MQAALRATWASKVYEVRRRKGIECSDAVAAKLERIRVRWANDVRVDTGHFKETIESAPVVINRATTSGYIQLPDEPYFYFNEYGTPGGRMAARPSMRQAVAAEQADFLSIIDGIMNSA